MIKADYEAWKAHPKTDPKNNTVQDWLKTIKVKDGEGKNSSQFEKLKGVVEKGFYEFYALGESRSKFEWRKEKDVSDVKNTTSLIDNS